MQFGDGVREALPVSSILLGFLFAGSRAIALSDCSSLAFLVQYQEQHRHRVEIVASRFHSKSEATLRNSVHQRKDKHGTS